MVAVGTLGIQRAEMIPHHINATSANPIALMDFVERISVNGHQVIEASLEFCDMIQGHREVISRG
ncbi:hypothetical protein D3C77_754210 [compost metagenome]